MRNAMMCSSALAAAVLLGVSIEGSPSWASGLRPAVANSTPNARPDATQATAPWQTARGKHNSSGVVMRYAVPDKIALGQSVTVRLQFTGVTAADGASVEVRDTASRAPMLSLRLAQGEQRTVDLTYTGRSDGMQFLDVTTTQEGRVTVQQVPLRVGSGELKLKSEGQRSTTGSGESIIVLPLSK